MQQQRVALLRLACSAQSTQLDFFSAGHGSINLWAPTILALGTAAVARPPF